MDTAKYDHSDLDRQLVRIENAARLGMLACTDGGDRLTHEQALNALEDQFDMVLTMVDRAYKISEQVQRGKTL